MLARPRRLAVLAALACAPVAMDANATACYIETGKDPSHYVVGRKAVSHVNVEKFEETRIAGADPKTFERLDENPCIAGYARDKNGVYYEGLKIAGADPRSFEPVSQTFARDRAAWYGENARIASRSSGDLRLLRPGYATHPEGAFYGARRLEAEGFEVLGESGYARSRNRAYFRGQAIAGIDAASFKVFDPAGSIARDKSNVVVNGRIDRRIHAESFEAMTPGAFLARDRDRVYLDLVPVEGAEPAGLAWLGRGYWRNRKALYYASKPVAGADPDSFRLFGLSQEYGLDKLRVYRDGVPLAHLDPSTFQVIDFGYARDRSGVYHHGKPMPGADPESFSVRIDGRGRDKSYGYEYAKRACTWAAGAAAGLPKCDPNRYGR